MITTTYNFTSGVGFVYDSTKIGFNGTLADLILQNNAGQIFTPTISSSVYDPALLEYVGGVLQQKDKRPSSATFYAAWSSFLDGNWGDGSLIVTPVNSASVSGGVLNLSGSTNKYVTFAAASNANSAQTGTIEFQFTPQYSGAPSTPQHMVSVFNTYGDTSNSIQILNYTGGQVYLQVYDSSNVLQININSAFSFVSGVTYTFILKYDFTAGNTSLSINGSVILSDNTILTRTNASTIVLIGKALDLVTGNANFNIANLAFYSTVVTPASPILSPTIYVAATATLPLFTYSGVGSLQAYTTFAITDSNAVVYTVNGKYWNGSAWVVSDGSYVQANSASTLNANIATLPALSTLQIVAIYQAQNVRGSFTALVVTYTGQIYPTSNPSISPNTPITMDQLSNFIDVISASGSDGVKWYLKIGSSPYWYNGSSWVVSDGTYSQSNLSTVILANASTLPISLGAFVTPFALLHSASGTTTPSLTSLTLTYDYFGPHPAGPNVCTVFGYIVDQNDNVVPNAVVSFLNTTTFENQGIIIAQGLRSTTTDSIGYFTITLVETTTVSVPINVSVTYPATVSNNVGNNQFTFGNAFIPNSPEANLTSLTFT